MLARQQVPGAPAGASTVLMHYCMSGATACRHLARHSRRWQWSFRCCLTLRVHDGGSRDGLTHVPLIPTRTLYAPARTHTCMETRPSLVFLHAPPPSRHMRMTLLLLQIYNGTGGDTLTLSGNRNDTLQWRRWWVRQRSVVTGAQCSGQSVQHAQLAWHIREWAGACASVQGRQLFLAFELFRLRFEAPHGSAAAGDGLRMLEPMYTSPTGAHTNARTCARLSTTHVCM